MARMTKLAPREWYTPYAVMQEQGFTKEQAWNEYRRLRRVARDRVRTLRAAGFKGAADELGLEDMKVKTDVDMAHALAELRSFVGRKDTTVSGARKARQRAIETFRSKYGLDDLTEENYDEFIEMLQKERERHPIKYLLKAVRAFVKKIKKKNAKSVRSAAARAARK